MPLLLHKIIGHYIRYESLLTAGEFLPHILRPSLPLHRPECVPVRPVELSGCALTFLIAAAYALQSIRLIIDLPLLDAFIPRARLPASLVLLGAPNQLVQPVDELRQLLALQGTRQSFYLS